MSLDSIIAKLKSVEGLDLSEDEINELQSAGQPKVNTGLEEELKQTKAAQARILEEKKKAQAAKDELEAKIEELQSKDMSEMEKAQKELDKALKIQEKMQKEYAELQAQHVQTVKSYNIEKIASGYNFVDSIPQDLRKLAIEKTFSDVDFSDEDAVKDAASNFKESYASILVSDDAAKGSGSNAGSKSDMKNKDPLVMSMEEREKRLKNLGASRNY